MEMNSLKIKILEAIINCNDASILKKVEEILMEDSEVGEPGENYIKEADPVPESHYRQLEEEFEQYKRGEIKEVSWKDFRKEIKKNHGF